MVNAVVWREGLFMRPQHFQQNDRHYAYELMTRTRELAPNQWGLFNHEIDDGLLGTGKVVLNRAYGIMPDGTLFDISTKTHRLVIDVNNNDAGKILYLALPLSVNYSDALYFEEEEFHPTRMVSQREIDVPNTNFGENSTTELLLAQHNFQLLFEENLNEGHGAIAIARIGSISASRIITLDESFSPAYLHLHNCLHLLSQLKELMSILSYRMVKLAEKLSDVGLQATELGDYLLLQLLNRCHSRLHFYLSQEKIHPAELFLELSSLAAELAVFMKKEKRLEKELNYEHGSQRESFDEVFGQLKGMLSMVLEQNSTALSIEKRKYGIHVARIEDKSLVDSSSFIFAVTADISTEKLKKMLLTNLKIGTIETIRDLVNYHLAGFKMKPLPVAPRQIPYRVNYLYFKLELTGEEREKLKGSGGFAFHFGGEIEGTVYSLWAIRNDDSKAK